MKESFSDGSGAFSSQSKISKIKDELDSWVVVKGTVGESFVRYTGQSSVALVGGRLILRHPLVLETEDSVAETKARGAVVTSLGLLKKDGLFESVETFRARLDVRLNGDMPQPAPGTIRLHVVKSDHLLLDDRIQKLFLPKPGENESTSAEECTISESQFLGFPDLRMAGLAWHLSRSELERRSCPGDRKFQLIILDMPLCLGLDMVSQVCHAHPFIKRYS